MNNSLKIRNLFYKRNDNYILKNINLSLKSSDILILKGLNGSGKSTLLNCINGTLINNLTFNELRYNNKEVKDHYSWKWFQNKINYIGNSNALNDHLSVKENLLYWGTLFGCDKYIKESLNFLDILHLLDLPTNILSVGQRKRVSLSKLMLIDRPLWLLDEPTLGLDTKSVRILSNLINLHSLDGGITIIATHNPLNLSNELYLNL